MDVTGTVPLLNEAFMKTLSNKTFSSMLQEGNVDIYIKLQIYIYVLHCKYNIPWYE